MLVPRRVDKNRRLFVTPITFHSYLAKSIPWWIPWKSHLMKEALLLMDACHGELCLKFFTLLYSLYINIIRCIYLSYIYRL